jgi:hypothetical protein
MRFDVTTLEPFLEDVSAGIEPSSDLGNLVLDPRYGIDPDPLERRGIKAELCSFRDSLSKHAQVRSPQGESIPIPGRYPLLGKYLQGMTLQRDRAGSWIQVLPQGFPG